MRLKEISGYKLNLVEMHVVNTLFAKSTNLNYLINTVSIIIGYIFNLQDVFLKFELVALVTYGFFSLKL